MKTIYKYSLDVADIQVISMPKGAKILSLAVQCDKPCLWVLIDPDVKMEDRIFMIYGTGHQFSLLDYNFIGTFLMHNDTLVFHVFEIND